MTKDKALVIESEDMDEWYGTYETCSSCETQFMCDSPSFCPGCGAKFIGMKKGNEIIYNYKGE